MRVFIILLLIAAAVKAEPPKSEHFRRMEDLTIRFAERHEKLSAAEAFAQKPRVEKILISFENGAKKFEKLKLTGENAGANVVKAILAWDELDKEPPTEDAERVLAKMGEVLEKKYARVVEIPKRERHKAALLLVTALMDERLHVRSGAFEALKKMYRTTAGYLYQPTASAKDRKEKQKIWKRQIDRESKR
ncbi:MAG: hypothetical protein ACYTG3_12385 [Planctomycetota bacterium]|jgi:hypothetical protein